MTTELGTKHECASCGTKFYDLGKSDALCPKCGADQKELAEAEATVEKPGRRKKRSVTKQAKPKTAAPIADAEEKKVAPEEENLDDKDLDDEND